MHWVRYSWYYRMFLRMFGVQCSKNGVQYLFFLRCNINIFLKNFHLIVWFECTLIQKYLSSYLHFEFNLYFVAHANHNTALIIK